MYNLQANMLSNIFVMSKINTMEIHQPTSTTDFDDSPTPTAHPIFNEYFWGCKIKRKKKGKKKKKKKRKKMLKTSQGAATTGDEG